MGKAWRWGRGDTVTECQSWKSLQISWCNLSFPFVGEKTSPEGEMLYLRSPERGTGIEPKSPVYSSFLLHQRSGGQSEWGGPPERVYMCLIPRCAGKP